MGVKFVVRPAPTSTPLKPSLKSEPTTESPGFVGKDDPLLGAGYKCGGRLTNCPEVTSPLVTLPDEYRGWGLLCP